MKVIVSDFDNTLFRRNVGLLNPQVDYLKERGLPIWILTYRAEDQVEFILETLRETNLDIVGVACAGSRKKDPATKFALLDRLSQQYEIVEAMDDDSEMVAGYKKRGIKITLA